MFGLCYLCTVCVRQLEFQSALHRSCMHGFLDLVTLLLDHGADIERRDRVRHCHCCLEAPCGIMAVMFDAVSAFSQTYTTPLLHACWNKHVKVCSFLIKHGAQWNVKNTQGLSPLDIAMQVSRGDLIHLFNVRQVVARMHACQQLVMIACYLQNFRKKLMRNRVMDLEQAAQLRNVAGVQEILGSTVDCIHTYPEVCDASAVRNGCTFYHCQLSIHRSSVRERDVRAGVPTRATHARPCARQRQSFERMRTPHRLGACTTVDSIFVDFCSHDSVGHMFAAISTGTRWPVACHGMPRSRPQCCRVQESESHP